MGYALTLKQLVKQTLPRPLLDLARELHYRRNRMPDYRDYQALFRGLSGVEIGGPSLFFRCQLPLYAVAASLDGVNFSSSTMWEGAIEEGGHFRFAPDRAGRQFIAEASALEGIDRGTYEFLVSSNCLEHVANPLKALQEWIRVVKPGGLLLLVLPNKTANFDHRRPTTTFAHLLEDYRCDTSEDDMTHLSEILALHDLARDPWAGSRENFERRCWENVTLRGMHHHVFDAEVIAQMASHLGILPIFRGATPTDYVYLGRTPGG